MPDSQTLVDAARAALHARGERMTAPRRAVLAALAGLGGPATADDVVTRVAASEMGVHRSSVYRSLEALVALGVVGHVHVGHGTTVYHLADAALLRAQCRHCAAIVEVDATVLDAARAALASVHGFALDATHVALSGTCAACQQAAVEAPR